MSTPAIASIHLSYGQLVVLEAAAKVLRVGVTGQRKTAATVLERHGLGLLEVGDDGWHFSINEQGRDQLRIRQ